MKKTSFLLLTIISIIMFSCSPSVDSLIDKYEKAAKSGDIEKMAKISIQIDEQLAKDNKDLTYEQAQRMAKASTNMNY